MRRTVQYELEEVSWAGVVKYITVNLDKWSKELISAPGGGVFLIREAASDPGTFTSATSWILNPFLIRDHLNEESPADLALLSEEPPTERAL
jgi:hypothetical protein